MADSALSPREIQARIRAGASVDDVATASGMDPSRVEAFAVPVLAEREFVAGLARAHPVRRGGEPIAHRTLGTVVTDRLEPRQVDLETLTWDAWKVEGRRWTVKVTWSGGRASRDARFTYDQAGRFSVADNDDARWLLGLHPPSVEQPSATPEEAEPTIGLNDDLALVRVVQPGAQPEDTRPIEGADDDGYNDDAYTEGELAEVDGMYDIVTNPTGGIDVLYDMLAGFDEDSVQIYSGLMRPDAGRPASPVLHEPPVAAESDEPSDEQAEPDEEAEPEQPSLLEDSAEPEAEPEPEPKAKTRRKRARVPSWDEIVFGSPTPRKPS